MIQINTNKKCVVCFGGVEKVDRINIKVNGSTKKIIRPMERHHIQYFPEVIAFVHRSCHEAIHEGKYPHLIQYQDGDSRKFYGEKE
jgi:hypothetical protein